MRLLLTCDDGIDSPGLAALVRAVAGHFDAAVVAPNAERSACGHSATLKGLIPVRPSAVAGARECFAVAGTPVDCVRLALGVLIREPVDCVISGINAGANLSVFDVHSSGTVAGAREGRLQGIPSIAVSQMYRKGEATDWTVSTGVVRRILPNLVRAAIRTRSLLNVNIPPTRPAAVPDEYTLRVAPLSTARLPLLFEQAARDDDALAGGTPAVGAPAVGAMADDAPADGAATAYEYRADFASREIEIGSDVAAVMDGAISVTPLAVDATDDALPVLKGLLES